MEVPAGNSGVGEAGKRRPGSLPEMTQGHTSCSPPSVFGAFLKRANRRHPTTDGRGMEGGGAFLLVMPRLQRGLSS